MLFPCFESKVSFGHHTACCENRYAPERGTAQMLMFRAALQGHLLNLRPFKNQIKANNVSDQTLNGIANAYTWPYFL